MNAGRSKSAVDVIARRTQWAIGTGLVSECRLCESNHEGLYSITERLEMFEQTAGNNGCIGAEIIDAKAAVCHGLSHLLSQKGWKR